MEVGVSLVLELAAEKPAVTLGQHDRLGQHAGAFLRRRREDDLGAEKAHQRAPLDAEVLRHADAQRIALLSADHGKAEAGVAAGPLEHRLTRAQRYGAPGAPDEAEATGRPRGRARR